MQQYAVTVVFYVNAESQDSAEMIVAASINDDILYKDRSESWSLVDTTEVKF